MKLHIWEAGAALYRLLAGNADGSAHADIRKVGGAALAFGQGAMAASLPVTIASNQSAVKTRGEGGYETVAAGQADQVLGGAGAAGDYLERLIFTPANVNPGAVSIKDGGGGAISLFAGGAASVADLAPFVIEVGAQSGAGAWKVTTGADVSVVAIGKFTA